MQYDPSVPAYLRDPNIIDDGAFSGGIGGQRGPHITVTNGRFLLVDTAGEQKPVATFDAQRGVYLDIVCVAANPGLAKTYYEAKYTPGNTTPPDCWSNDGIEPDASILEPQNLTCHGCPKNIFGSAVTDNGKQAKACSDRKRLAVMYVYDFNGPLYEFSISPSNLKLWNEHVQNLQGRGIPIRGVVTRVYTDATRQGGLLFEAAANPQGAGVWYVPENLMPIVQAAMASEECKRAIGVTKRPLALAAPAQQQIAAPAPVAPAPTPAFGSAPPVQQPSTTAGTATTAFTNGGDVDPTEAAARRPRRTKAQMEADRRAQAVGQPVATPSVVSAAGFATIASPSNGAFGAPAPVNTGFGPAPEPAFSGPTTIQAPQPTQQAAFGIVTNPTPASAEVDAMLQSVLGQPR